MPNRLGKGIAALLVLATICGVLAFVSTWADRQLFKTGYWSDTSAELIEQPEIRDAVSAFLVDQLFANVDVQAELQAGLPENLKGLSGPAAAGLRELADRAADRALSSPRVQQAWVSANTAAHEAAIKIISGDTDRVTVENGVVTMDLKALLRDLATRVGVGEKLISKLPQNAGTIVVLQSDELKSAQNAYDVVRVFAVVMTILTVLLYALAIGLAAGRRRRAVAFVGASIVTVGAGALLLGAIAKQPLVDALATTEAVRPAVVAVYDISTGLLREQAGSFIFTGILVMLGAWLAGTSRPATSFRRSVAPYLRHQLPAAAAFTAVVYLMLVWWGPTLGFRTSSGLIINTLFAIGGFVGLTMITRREFPDVEPVDFHAVGQRVKDAFTGERATAMREKAKGAVSRGGSVSDEIEKLSALHASGALTDEEFAAQKQKLLGQ